MNHWHTRLTEFLRVSLLDWKSGKGNESPASATVAFEESAGRYEVVEQVCLRRGQRSRRVVRRLVEEA